jgi:hypothetical protein
VPILRVYEYTANLGRLTKMDVSELFEGQDFAEGPKSFRIG